MELLKWGLAGFKGSNEIEGVLDKAIADFVKGQQQGGEKKPSPEEIKAQTEIQKMQLELQKAQMAAQADQQRIQAEMAQQAQEHAFKMEELRLKHEAEMMKIRAEISLAQQKEEAQAEGAAAESVVKAASQIEINKSAPKKPEARPQ
jgi:hypothetical protein